MNSGTKQPLTERFRTWPLARQPITEKMRNKQPITEDEQWALSRTKQTITEIMWTKQPITESLITWTVGPWIATYRKIENMAKHPITEKKKKQPTPERVRTWTQPTACRRGTRCTLYSYSRYRTTLMKQNFFSVHKKLRWLQIWEHSSGIANIKLDLP